MRNRSLYCLSILIISAVLLVFWTGAASGMEEARFKSGSFTEFLPLVASEQPVYISEYHIKTTPSGRLRFVGEVMNKSGIPIYDVIVRVLITDDNGQTHEFLEAPVFSSTLPGQPNPFDISAAIDDDLVLTEITVDISNWAVDNDQIFAEATVISILVDDELNYATVTTTIRNDQMQPMYNVVGSAWSFETWTLFESQLVADVLQPGETVEFITILGGVSLSEANIQAAAQGELGP